MLRQYVSLAKCFAKSTIVVALAAVILAAAVSAVVFKPSYTTSATIELALASDGRGNAANDLAAATQLAATAQTLVLSPRVLAPAAKRVGGSTTSADLAATVKLTTAGSSLVYVLKTQGATAESAEGNLRAIAEEFQGQLAERPLTSADGRITVNWVSVDYDTVATVGSSVARMAISAVLAGLLIGLAYLLVRIITDDRIRYAWQVGEVTEHSVVASLDAPPTSVQSSLLANGLDLLVAPVGRGRIVGLVGLSVPSAASVVLGVTEALGQSGKPAVAVDADLRGRSLGSADSGLAEHLAGTSSEALGQTGKVLAGNAPPNPAELLERPRFQQVLADLADRHDWVIVNCPPIVPVADTALIAGRLDGLLVVVQANKDGRRQLEEALAVLQAGHANVLGVVLLGAIGSAGRSPYTAGASALGV